MKRNVIIATVAAVGVVGGAALAGTALAEDGTAEDRTPRTLNTGTSEAGSDSGAADRGADERDDRGEGKARQDTAGSDGNSGHSWISAEQAVARALKAEAGHAYKLELEEDDRVWEVDILTKGGEWRQVDVARKGGEVLRSKTDDDDDDNRPGKAERVRAVLEGAKVSLGDAARIANERVSGTIEEIELEKRGTVWEVEFEDVDGRDDDDDVELRVNVESGKATIHSDNEDDRGDRDDDHDDDRDDDRDDD